MQDMETDRKPNTETLADFLCARLDDDENLAIDGVIGEHGTEVGFDLRVRWLRDVDAKRRIVELHEPMETPDPLCSTCDYQRMPCPTLRLLTLPYAEHPKFREEWRL